VTPTIAPDLMAQAEDLSTYKEAYDLCLYLEQVTRVGLLRIKRSVEG
jgi:hypothetical protein